jgi:hypothetical protein
MALLFLDEVEFSLTTFTALQSIYLSLQQPYLGFTGFLRPCRLDG